MSGNFRRSWLLGQDDVFADSALLAPAGSEQENFDSFIARFDENGSLIWAQSSGFAGNDFAVDLAADQNGALLLLGNRKVDGSFGPYLLKIRSDEQTPKNAPLVEFDPSANEELLKIFSWEPPTTIRFAEPVDGSYFSASAVGRPSFQYEINGESAVIRSNAIFYSRRYKYNRQIIQGR